MLYNVWHAQKFAVSLVSGVRCLSQAVAGLSLSPLLFPTCRHLAAGGTLAVKEIEGKAASEKITRD